jgi:DNA-directed RNA polymerase specialized sigma24 family protein
MPGPHPTNRPDTPTLTAERRAALQTFYDTHHRRLASKVHRAVEGITPWDAEDVCGFAWLRLTHRDDITLDRRGFAWLATVAVREGWRLTNAPELGPLPDPIGLLDDPLEHALATSTHNERLQRFAQLKPRERRDLLLFAAGYSYREIAAMTNSTYTAVNRRITEGRSRLFDH